MTGYKKDFLDNIVLPLPGFSPMLEETVLRNTHLDEEIYAHYVNYSVITSKDKRAPIISALNIDQNKLKSTRRRDKWQIDSRIGAEHQLNNDYYHRNPWDRGHLARRAAASWGDSSREAQRASDETFYYSNASLQHENFNQDEWLALEEWVSSLDLDKDGKITSFSGPVYGDFTRIITPEGREFAEIPSAFFKIVCFVNKHTDALDVRSFLMYQDIEALADKKGRRALSNFQIYQVTVSEVEEKTGLEFDNAIYESNPLLYRENEKAREDLNVTDFPERIEVDSVVDIQDKETPRVYVADEEVDVFIIASMVNPKGKERDGEWVSIINLSAEDVNLNGWTLWDHKRKKLQLNTVVDEDSLLLSPGDSVVIKPVSPLMLSNAGGTISLFNENDQRIDRVKYSRANAKPEGKPVIFNNRAEPRTEVKSVEHKASTLSEEPI